MARKTTIIIPFALSWQKLSHCERQTALSLAKKNFNVIVYIHPDAHYVFKHSIASYPRIKNIIFYKPAYPIPFKRFPVIEKINQIINLLYLKKFYLKNNNVWLWIFNHKFYFFPNILGLKKRSLFDCVEYPSSLDKKVNILIRKEEEMLINNTQNFFVDSPTLLHKWQRYKPILAPQGYEPLDTKNINKQIEVENKIDKWKTIIGYVGNINYRIDFPLVYKLIKNRPNWLFLFVGNIEYFPSEDKRLQTKRWLTQISKLNNYCHIPEQDKSSLARLIKLCQVCIIPYNKKLKFNYFSRTLKIYDYFILNKPVVSTPILESVRMKKIIKIENTEKGFENAISSYLKKPLAKSIIKAQNKLCLENTWDKKVEFILNYLDLR